MNNDYTHLLTQLFFSYLINIIVFLIAPLGTIILSRGLPLADFGIYALFFTFLNIGLHGFPFGTQLYIQNYLPGKPRSEQYKVIGTLLTFTITISTALFLFWFLLLRKPILAWLTLSNYNNHSLLLFIAIGISMLNIIFFSWLISQRKLIFTNILHLANSSVWILLTTVDYFLTGCLSLWRIMLYWIIGALLQFVLSIIIFRKKLIPLCHKLLFNTSIIRQAFFFGFPLVTVILNPWLLTGVERIIITRSLTKETLAQYSLIYALINLITSFTSIIAGTFYPYIARAWNTGKEKQHLLLLNAAFKYTLIIVFPSMFGMYVLREPLLTLIAGAKFISALTLVPYIILFPLFSSLLLLLHIPLLIRGKSTYVGMVYLGGIVVDSILNFILIPFFGIHGAALALILTYFLMFIILSFYARPFISLHLDFIKIPRILLATIAMTALLSFFNPQHVIAKIGVIILGIISYTLFLFLFKIFGTEEFIILTNLAKNSRLTNLFFRNH